MTEETEKDLLRYLCYLLFNQFACERLVLDGLQTWWDGIRTHPWGQMDDREGTGWVLDLTLIDSGWKDKQWGTEPVYILAAQAGFRGILPCKGRSPWQQRCEKGTGTILFGRRVGAGRHPRRLPSSA